MLSIFRNKDEYNAIQQLLSPDEDYNCNDEEPIDDFDKDDFEEDEDEDEEDDDYLGDPFEEDEEDDSDDDDIEATFRLK